MTTLDQNGPGNNGNKRLHTFPKSPQLEPHSQRRFSVISRTLICSRFYPCAEMPSAYFTSSTNRATLFVIFHCLMQIRGRVFSNGPGNRGSIPGRVIPKTLKMVLYTS